jgi:hypothetical protein
MSNSQENTPKRQEFSLNTIEEAIADIKAGKDPQLEKAIDVLLHMNK